MSEDKKLPNPFEKIIHRMLTTFAEHQWQAILRSFVLARRDEKKARLRVIMDLSCELAKIKAVNIQSTAFGEMIIEAVIEGNWKEAADINGDLTFADFGESREYYCKLWEDFRALVMAACAEAARREAGQVVEPD